MIKKVVLPVLACLMTTLSANAQSEGDTVVVQTLEFNDITKRRGWYEFPNDTTTYSKILMYYTLKCDAATTQDGYPCGEWDYTTYTNLYEHLNVGGSYYEFAGSGVDSAVIGTNPTFDVNQSYQYFNVVDNVTGEIDHAIGAGSTSLDETFSAANTSGKSQYLFSAAELTTAGLSAGDIERLSLDVSVIGSELSNLRIALKNSALTELTSASHEMDGFTKVYELNTTFSATGEHVFEFLQPFNWDGTSSIVVEFAFDNGTAGTASEVNGDDSGFNSGVVMNDDNGYLDFQVGDYVRVPETALSSISNEVTVSFWCYGDPTQMPMNSYTFEGRDANNNRVINVHLPWSNSRVYWDCGNDGGGSYDRIDEAANFEDFAGQWNHWAFTKNATTGEMAMYLNGVLFASGTGKTRVMSPITSFKIAGPGSNNEGRYRGFIEEFRVWNKSLDGTTIADWMHKSLDNSHPDWANLLVAYDFNEMSGVSTTGYSDNMVSGSLMGLPLWENNMSSHLYLNAVGTTNRPNITFKQGTYTSHIDSVMVVDTAWHSTTSLVEYSTEADTSVSGITLNAVDTTYVYEGDVWCYTYGPNGDVVDSTFIAATSTVYSTYEQVTHQLQNYVTPYGIGLDLGPNGFRWVYDVTDYTPILKGLVEISAGNQQELIDLKFMMIVGTPGKDVVDFETIWLGDYQHSNIANDISMPAVDLDLNSSASSYIVKTRTTGHWFGGFENCAEFCPKFHNLKIDGTQRFEWLNWTDCASNPVVAQGGTWVYDRAGWCPGAFGDTYNHDITNWVTPGSSVSIDYGMETTAGGMEGNYRTAVQLVSYGDYNFQNDGAIEDVISPNNWEYHNRMNPICDHPKIVIKNNGQQNLTSASIRYWVCGDAPLTFEWTGDLNYGQTEEVTLPIPDIEFWAHAQYCNTFNAEIYMVNGVEDEYASNSRYETQFEMPDLYPNEFFIWYKSNSSPWENQYTITDLDGNVVFAKTQADPNTTYRDTLNLPQGCYKLTFTDSGEDGLAFFANTAQGSGYIMTRRIGGGTLDQFETDFGDQFVKYFTVGYAVDMGEEIVERFVDVYPNPAKNELTVEVDGFGGEVVIEIRDALGRVVEREIVQSPDYLSKTQFDITRFENGVYTVNISDASNVISKRFIKQ